MMKRGLSSTSRAESEAPQYDELTQNYEACDIQVLLGLCESRAQRADLILQVSEFLHAYAVVTRAAARVLSTAQTCNGTLLLGLDELVGLRRARRRTRERGACSTRTRGAHACVQICMHAMHGMHAMRHGQQNAIGRHRNPPPLFPALLALYTP